MFSYFQIVYLFKDNYDLFIINFSVSSLIIVYVIILIVITLSSDYDKDSFSVIHLRYIIKLIISPFYIPLLLSFLSVSICENNKSYFNQNITCFSGVFYFYFTVGIFFAIIFFFLSFFFLATFYLDNLFHPYSPLAKMSSCQDINLLFVKTILVLTDLFILRKTSNLSQWVVLTIYLIISIFLLGSFYLERPYINQKLQKLQIACLTIFLWATIVVLINKIVESTIYNGGIWLFFFGSVLILFFYYYFDISHLSPYFFFRQNTSEIETLHKIFLLIKLIEGREMKRNSELILKRYIYLYEGKCDIKDCPLKKILKCDGKESMKDIIKYLFLHIEIIFLTSIDRFPNSKRLRLAYCFFLLNKLKKKHHSLIELENCENLKCSLEEEFILFKLKKYIEGFDDLMIKKNRTEEHDIILFKKELSKFKSEIKRVSIIYTEFWGILLFSNKSDLDKLSKIGKKISKGIEHIELIFKNLQEIKENDKEVLICYVEFLISVVNDKDSSRKFRHILFDATKKEKDITNLYSFDVENFNLKLSNSTSDSNQYVILSSQPESFGIITNISLGLCMKLGFSRNEIVGKSYEIVIPEIFIKKHNEILQRKAIDFRKELINLDFTESKYHGKEITGLFVSKSKYLVPISIRAGTIPNETFDFSFIAKIVNSKLSSDDYYLSKECYVLTNNDLIIQHFTSNAISLLGLNSKCINGNLGIIEYIKEFYEEYLKCVVENEARTHEHRAHTRTSIIKNKYCGRNHIITWKKSELGPGMISSKRISKFDSTNFNNLQVLQGFKKETIISSLNDVNKEQNYQFITSNTSNDAIKLILIVTEQIINNEQVGYIFKFGGLNGVTQTLKDGLDNITKDFVPESTSKFLLDVDDLSYKFKLITNENESIEKKRNEMRSTVIQRLQQAQPITKKTLSSIESSEEDSSSYTESNEESAGYSSSNQISKSSDSAYSKTNEKLKVDQANTPIEKEDYYHVKMTNIKWSIYDFKKKTFCEIENYEKISQVLDKMTDKEIKGKNQGNRTNEKDNTTIDSYLQYNDSSPYTRGGHNLQFSDKNQVQIIQNKIEKSLSKQESQPTIVTFQKASAFTIIVLSAIGACYLYFQLDFFKILKENVVIIQKSNYLSQDLLFGQFYVRQLTLLYHENFTNFVGTREETVLDIQRQITGIYNSSINLTNYIITTNVPFSKKIKEKIEKESITMVTIKSDFNVSSYNVTLFTALEELNTALYHVTNVKLSNLIPSNRNIFVYLRNSLNSVYVGIMIQNALFKEQLDYLVKQYKIILTFAFVISVILIIICFLILSMTYSKVSIKKESYLEVFFDINKKIIQNFLENCENFNKKMQDDLSNDSTMSSNFDLISEDFNEQNMINDTNKPAYTDKENKNNENNSNSIVNPTKGSGRIQYRASISVGLLKVKLKLGIIFLLIIVYLTTMFSLSSEYLSAIKEYCRLFQDIIDSYNIIFCFYNSLREYLFDSTNIVYGQYPNYFSDSFISIIYDMVKEKEEIVYSIMAKSSLELEEYFSSINDQSICHYIDNHTYQENEEKYNCTSFFYGSGKQGLRIFKTTFIEEIRYIKNLYDIYITSQKHYGFQYNLTLLGTGKDKEFWPEDPSLHMIYFKLNQIRVFNWEKIQEVNFGFLNVLKPACLDKETYVEQYINNMIIEKDQILMWMSIGLILFNLIWFFGIFVPFINRLNQTIYKAKNMLVIIPKHVLINVPNILNVLNIDYNIVFWNREH